MPKRTTKNLPIYEYDKKVNGQTRYYIRPYINGKQTTIRLDENGEMWLGREGYQRVVEYCSKVTNPNYVTKKQSDKTFKEMFFEMQEYNEMHNNNSVTTRMEYESKMKNHIFNLAIADKKITKWTSHDYEEIIVLLRRKKITYGSHKGENLKINTINSICRIISSVFKYAKTFYKIENIVKEVGYVKENRDKIVECSIEDLLKQNKSLNDDAWDSFIQASNSAIEQEKNEYRKIFLKEISLLITCEYILFLRVGEAQGLIWKNFYGNVYTLFEAWNKKILKMMPLKNREKRLLYIPRNLVQSLENLRQEKIKLGIYNENEFIFGGSAVIPRTTIDRYRHKICDDAGIKRFSNHFLRHAGESYALANNVDPTTIATMAGHRLQMMLDTYISTVETSNRFMVNTLNQIKVPII